MKFPKLVATSIVAIILLAATLTGCTPVQCAGSCMTQSAYVGIVMGNTAYAPAITKSSFESLLQQTVSPGTHLVVYSSEGTPRQLFNGIVTWDQSAQHVDESFAAEIKKIEVAVLDSVPTTPQSNPVEALLQIVQAFGRHANGSEVLMLDPMLNTTGAVRLQDGSLYGSPADTVAFMRSKDYLPTGVLKGVRVVFTETGAVPPGSKQPTLDSVSERRLSGFWAAIVKAGGGSVSTASATFGAPVPSSQPVAVVPVTPVEAPIVNCSIALDGSQVSFVGDSAEFINRDQALSVVAATAARLKNAGCNGKVSLVGTTSSAGTPASRYSVASARALAVRDLLAADLKVATDTIATHPVGYDTKYCATDTNSAGVLVPSLAARCRLVVIVFG